MCVVCGMWKEYIWNCFSGSALHNKRWLWTLKTIKCATSLDFALFSGELLLQDIETIALQLYYSSFFISLTEYEVYYCRVLCCTAANGVFYGSFKKCSEAALLWSKSVVCTSAYHVILCTTGTAVLICEAASCQRYSLSFHLCLSVSVVVCLSDSRIILNVDSWFS